jgi:hypothetical protein
MGPAGARGNGHCEAHALESFRRAQVGEPEILVNFPVPKVAWQLRHWRHGKLGQVPIPLRPDRGLIVREIERIDDRSALPASIRWGRRTDKRFRTLPGMSKPGGSQVSDRLDVERHAASGSAGFVECGDEAQHFNITTLSHEIDGLLVTEGRDRLRQPHGHVLGGDHA